MDLKENGCRGKKNTMRFHSDKVVRAIKLQTESGTDATREWEVGKGSIISS